jgi:hypothetical protein
MFLLGWRIVNPANLTGKSVTTLTTQTIVAIVTINTTVTAPTISAIHTTVTQLVHRNLRNKNQ